MSGTSLQEVALALRNAYRDGPIDSLGHWLDGLDAELAYRIQEINTRHWLGAGRRIVGRKIGLTSRAVQQQLGVDQPDYGILYADTEIASGGEIAADRLLQPRAEAEVAFVLQRDLSDREFTRDDLTRAVGYVSTAIEIADSRIRNWKITLAGTIADNASAGAYVVGAGRHVLADVDLESCVMVLTSNNEVVSTGTGAACLGHPLNALDWLARKMIEHGRPLEAGDVVLSGALGPMTAVAAGDVLRAEITGLGAVSVRFR